jgi:hypothetical protein
MTTPDNTATSWRDIADQLTPKQIAELERSEQGYANVRRSQNPGGRASRDQIPSPWCDTRRLRPRSSTAPMDELLDERLAHRGWAGEDATVDT